MKHSLKFVTLMALSILALSSCKKEALDSAVPQTAPAATQSANGIVISPIPVATNAHMKLRRRGQEIINYQTGPSGSFVNSVFDDITDNYWSFHNVIQSSNKPHTWRQWDYVNNDQVMQRDYVLNPDSTVNLVKTDVLDPDFHSLSVSYDSMRYNAQQQLSRHMTPTGWHEFTYNGNGDMIKKKTFNNNGQLVSETAVTYSVRGLSYTDKNSLNHDYLNMNRYVRFFGKMSTHLPLRIATVTNGVITSDINYNYTFNTDGTIKTQTKTNGTTNQIIEFLNFTYQPQ